MNARKKKRQPREPRTPEQELRDKREFLRYVRRCLAHFAGKLAQMDSNTPDAARREMEGHVLRSALDVRRAELAVRVHTDWQPL